MLDVTLFKKGDLEVRVNENGEYLTVGSTMQIAREASELCHELKDAISRIACEFENLGLTCSCHDDGACSVCEILFLVKEYSE